MLVEMLMETARRSPRVPAVDDGIRALDYGGLLRLSRVFREVVQGASASPRVGIMLPASSAFPGALMGVLWSGRVAVPLNFLLSAEELAPVVTHAGLDVILTVRPLAELAGRLPARALYLEDLGLKRRWMASYLRRTPPVARVGANDTAVILYTSGTTGMPKGVELTYGNLHSNCRDTIASLEIPPKQVFLNVLPPFHVFGLTANVLVPIALGASVYAIPRFHPLAAIKTIAEKQVTVVMAIPSMYAAMLKTKSASPAQFSSIYLAVSGGEPLPESVREGFVERFGVSLRQGYGLTETSPVVAACSATNFRDGTVGRPIRHVEVRIVDPEGRPLSGSADGEILVRGPGVMKGYYRSEGETRQVIDAEGWFRTGDIGHIDGDGFLVITGRAKEMLIIGGENVFPREIEAVLEAHPAVLQVAVIGMPDPLRGECACAFVIPRKGETVTEEELRQFSRKSLAGFKVPRSIQVHEDLPTGPTGKILKRKLRELITKE